MASLAQFFFEGGFTKGAAIALDEQTAKHIVQVLRMQPGGRVKLCNGNGAIATATITDTAKKKCKVIVDGVELYEEPRHLLHLAVAFTKNSSRNEWLLEKATELGVRSIIPLAATRSEKEHIRHERWKNILVSAMLQSQGAYLPHLTESLAIQKLVEKYEAMPQKLIAHCIEGKEKLALPIAMKTGNETILLIGPEGDFTAEEVDICEGHGFKAVSLGTQRLRTETAAMAACAYFNMINNVE